MNGEIVIVDDVAAAFTEEVVRAFEGRPQTPFSIALSGGPTAHRCYEHLGSAAADRIDWWEVDVYWGDERCVPPDDDASNERMARETLLKRIGAVNAYFPMRCDEGPEAYQMKIANLDYLDIVHLGLGPDGHTASLFPESEALDADPGRLVVLNSDPRGVNPHERMTLTYSGIAKGRHVVFTVSGAAKKEALQALADGEDLPAARVRADRITWLVDREAAPDRLRPPGRPS